MGDHVSMDAYNYRFDKVTEGEKNKKCCGPEFLKTNWLILNCLLNIVLKRILAHARNAPLAFK